MQWRTGQTPNPTQGRPLTPMEAAKQKAQADALRQPRAPKRSPSGEFPAVGPMGK